MCIRDSFIYERKGTDPHWKHLRCTHFASYRGSRNVITSLCSAHSLASSLKLAVRCPVNGCWLLVNFVKFFMIPFNFLSQNLWNFLNWNLQLKSVLENVPMPIFWSTLLSHPHPSTPHERLKTHLTANRATFRIPYITHRSAVTFRTFHSTFYFRIPHAAILHFTNSPGRRTRSTSACIYSPCATDVGKQGELDLCRYLHIGIGPAIIHKCPQLSASLENSSTELWKICRGTFTLGVREAKAWLYKFKQCYVALSSLIDK